MRSPDRGSHRDREKTAGENVWTCCRRWTRPERGLQGPVKSSASQDRGGAYTRPWNEGRRGARRPLRRGNGAAGRGQKRAKKGPSRTSRPVRHGARDALRAGRVSLDRLAVGSVRGPSRGKEGGSGGRHPARRGTARGGEGKGHPPDDPTGAAGRLPRPVNSSASDDTPEIRWATKRATPRRELRPASRSKSGRQGGWGNSCSRGAGTGKGRSEAGIPAGGTHEGSKPREDASRKATREKSGRKRRGKGDRVGGGGGRGDVENFENSRADPEGPCRGVRWARAFVRTLDSGPGRGRAREVRKIRRRTTRSRGDEGTEEEGRMRENECC